MKTFELIKQLNNPELTGKEKCSLEWDVVDAALEEKVPVEIYYNNETGKFQWAVQIIGTDFWIDAFTTKEDAVEYCVEEGLPVVQ